MASSSLPSPFSETTLGLISPTSIPPFKRDLYCWVCHVDGPLLKCKTCSRAYHRNCANQLGSLCHTAEALMDTESPSPHFMKGCPECQMGTKTIFPNMKQAPIQELRLICVAIARNLRDGYFWPNPFYKLDTEKSPKEFQEYKDIVAKVVDISELEKLAGNDQFVTLEGFLGEAKWILHNTIIVHGKCSREADCAKEIIDICELELLAAELCPECFLKEHNREKDELWFIKPCLRHPHPLGWAKTPSNPNWPVKIMGWTPGSSSVTVRSFGDYQRFDIPPSKCYLYMKNPPKFDSHRGERGEDAKLAQKEAEQHVTELEKVMGKVRLPEKECRLSSLGSLDNAIKFMFPELERIWCPNEDEEEDEEVDKNTPTSAPNNNLERDDDVANNN